METSSCVECPSHHQSSAGGAAGCRGALLAPAQQTCPGCFVLIPVPVGILLGTVQNSPSLICSTGVLPGAHTGCLAALEFPLEQQR